jgi:hypothetical protein
MMQLNCLPLRNKSVTDRILDQDILYRLIRRSCTPLSTMEPLLAGANEQSVEDI